MTHRSRCAWNLLAASTLAAGLVLAPSAEAGRGGGGGGGHFGGGGGRSFGGGHSFGGGGRTFSGGGSRSFSGGSRSFSGGSRSYGGGSRSFSSGSRSYGGSRSYTTTSGRAMTSAQSGGRTTAAPPRSAPSPHDSYRGSIGNPGGAPGHPGSGGGHPGGGGYPGHGGHGGGYYGGHYGGYYHYPWYNNWYWGFGPYWGAYGWLWGWPWYSPWYYGWGPYGGVYVGGYGGYAEPAYWAGHFGRVKTDVEPEEAEVWLNGNYIGTADDFDGYPDYLYLEPGSYHLEFRLAGYQTWAQELEIHRGEGVKLDHELASAPGHGKLDSFSPEKKPMPYGRFFARGGVPTSPDAGRETRGPRDDSGEGPIGIDDRDPGTDVQGSMDQAPPPPPARQPDASRGRIRWDVSPEDAAVWVDDRYVGTGDELSSRPRGVAIAPGHHTVTVVRPGFKVRTLEVDVEAGKAIDVAVELEK